MLLFPASQRIGVLRLLEFPNHTLNYVQVDS
jgi:hypothetical protein